MKTLLKFVSEQSGLVFILLGAVIGIAAWVPFAVKFDYFTIAAPTTMPAQIVLSSIGAVLFLLGLYLTTVASHGGPIFEPTIIDYTSYVSVVGTAEECANGKGRLQTLVSGEFRTPWFTELKYVGRIRTGGKITRFETVPRYTNLIPEQYFENPTYLEFEIRPGLNEKRRTLTIHAALTVETKLTPEQGKVGAHFPYATRKATLVVDFRGLGFKLAKPPAARIESTNPAGILVTGLISPRRWDFDGGSVLSLVAQDIPANSSFVVIWGMEQEAIS